MQVSVSPGQLISAETCMTVAAGSRITVTLPLLFETRIDFAPSTSLPTFRVADT
jgi:hypothetical protein